MGGVLIFWPKTMASSRNWLPWRLSAATLAIAPALASVKVSLDGRIRWSIIKPILGGGTKKIFLGTMGHVDCPNINESGHEWRGGI